MKVVEHAQVIVRDMGLNEICLFKKKKKRKKRRLKVSRGVNI